MPSSPGQAAVHQMLRGENDAPQHSLFSDDADIGVEIKNLRQAVAGFQFVVAQQLVGDRDTVDAIAAGLQLGHAGEDPAVLLHAKNRRAADPLLGCRDRRSAG